MSSLIARHRGSAAVLAFCAAAAACGGTTPTSPTPIPQTSGPPAGSVQTPVRFVDVISGAPVSGVIATVGSNEMARSNVAGQSIVWGSTAGQFNVACSESSYLKRTTFVKTPGSETTISLIPASFDLVSFDQMFRSSSRLVRWTVAPPLVILTRAVQYETTTSNTLTVLADALSPDEQQGLLKDLTDGLAALTDQRFPVFASVTFETPDVGSRVNVLRVGSVLVARAKDLTERTRSVSPNGYGYWGYSRWATDAGGAVVGGNSMLDADFESSGSRYRRSLRIHELGHALGYNHVTGRQSVMNSAATIEPNTWDLQAVHIAFRRPTGNTTPDTDPSGFSLNLRTGAVTWSAPIY